MSKRKEAFMMYAQAFIGGFTIAGLMLVLVLGIEIAYRICEALNG
jgi:hypothetical protein